VTLAANGCTAALIALVRTPAPTSSQRAEEEIAVTGHGGWSAARVRLIALVAAGTVVTSALALAGTATSANAQPAAAGRAQQGPHAAAASPIKHVVVLYLENHSFDSLLGYWCHQHAGRCPDGGMPASVKLSDGSVVTPGVSRDIVPNVDHSVSSQVRAIDGGNMDGWQNVPGCSAATGYRCISGYKPSQIPNLARLATKFAISDRTFSMADSPSWGGHLYAVMGSLNGFTGDNPNPAPGVPPGPGWGCNSRKITPWISPGGVMKLEPSCIPDFSIGRAHGGAFRATPVSYHATILDRLTAAGLTWKLFGEPDAPKSTGGTAGGYGWDICPSFAECLYTKQKANNVQSSTFVKVARAGKLPNFAVVTPGGKDAAFSEHNGFSITAGDDWLGQIASAIMNGPQWRSTVLFITWDDCGCFYDQVRPGTNPDGTPQGPRTPLVIVSPYVKAHYTDRNASTMAGILAFTERTFGLKALGVNDKDAYPFTNAFNYDQPPLRPARMVYRPWPADAYHVNMKEADQDT
jgi:phospholipase C